MAALLRVPDPAVHARTMTLAVQRDRSLERRVTRLGVEWDSPIVRYLLRLAPSSRRPQIAALRAAADAFATELGAVDWPSVNNAQLGALRAWVAERFAPATANRILCAVRNVLHECARAGAMTYDAYKSAVDIPPVRGSRERRGRNVELDEGARLFAAARAKDGPIGARRVAILATMLRGGLRREEVTKVRLSDVDERAWVLRVIGKGNKERRVPLPPKTAELIAMWIAVRGRVDGPLFCQVRPVAGGAWRIHPKRGLSTTILYRDLCELAQAAKVPHVSPHDLRATYCGDILDAVGDLRIAQGLMGHVDITTTARYDRRGERVARAAVQKLEERF